MKKSFLKLFDNVFVPMDKAVPSSTYKHSNKLGAGAAKRKKLKNPDDKFEAVMHEFKTGKLHSGSGGIVTSRQQALAIAGSESGKYMKEDKSALAIGTKIEAEHKETFDFIRNYYNEYDEMPPEKEVYKHIAENHLAEFKNYYTALIAMEKKLKSDKMEKAKMTKYVKRESDGKGGYRYWYKEDQGKGSILSGIMSFFGFKDTKQAQEKVKQIYQTNKESLSGVSIDTFSDYVNEYLSNKDKWDKRFQKKEIITKDKKTGTVKRTNASDKKAVIPSGNKSYNLSLMKQIAGIVGGEGKEKVVRDDEENKINKNSLQPDIVQGTVEIGGMDIDVPIKIVYERIPEEWSYIEKKKKKYTSSQGIINDLKEKGISVTKEPTRYQGVAYYQNITANNEKNWMKNSTIKINDELKKQIVEKIETLQNISLSESNDKTSVMSSKEDYSNLFKVIDNRENVINEATKHTNTFQGSLTISQILKDKGMWTDGSVLITDKEFTDKIYNKITKKHQLADTDATKRAISSIDRVIPKDENVSDSPLSFPNGVRGDDPKFKILKLKGKDFDVALKASYVQLLQKQYGNDLSFYPSSSPMEPVTIKSGGKKVGVLMPVRIRDSKGGDVDFSSIEEFSKKLKEKKLKEPPNKMSQEKINVKNITDPQEKEYFNKFKPKNAIKEHDYKPFFNYNEFAKNDGVWTDAKIMIIDKTITNKIYDTNLHNAAIKAIKINPELSLDAAKEQVKEKDFDYNYPKWKEIIPKEENISKKEANFTGKLTHAVNLSGYFMQYSDGNTETYLNPDQVATIKSMFPSAKMHIVGEMSPVVFKVNNEIKAIAMPVKKQQDAELKNFKDVESSLQKAFSNLLTDLQKAKKAEIGEVRTYKDGTKRQKMADGTWKPVKSGKGSGKDPDKKDDKGIDKKKPDNKKDKNDTGDTKTKIKGILKKMADLLADALSGKNTVQPAGETVEQIGENITPKGKKKDVRNNERDRNKK